MGWMWGGHCSLRFVLGATLRKSKLNVFRFDLSGARVSATFDMRTNDGKEKMISFIIGLARVACDADRILRKPPPPAQDTERLNSK
jgi:hypothetical protein